MWCSPAEATRIGVGVRIALTRQRRASESRDGSVGMGRRVATRRKEGRRPPPQTASLMSGLLRRTSAFFPSNRRDLTSEALIGAPRMKDRQNSNRSPTRAYRAPESLLRVAVTRMKLPLVTLALG